MLESGRPVHEQVTGVDRIVIGRIAIEPFLSRHQDLVPPPPLLTDFSVAAVWLSQVCSSRCITAGISPGGLHTCSSPQSTGLRDFFLSVFRLEGRTVFGKR